VWTSRLMAMFWSSQLSCCIVYSYWHSVWSEQLHYMKTTSVHLFMTQKQQLNSLSDLHEFHCETSLQKVVKQVCVSLVQWQSCFAQGCKLIITHNFHHILWPILVKFGLRDCHIVLLSNYDFCEGWWSESHTSVKGITEILSIFSTCKSSLGKMGYRKWPQEFVWWFMSFMKMHTVKALFYVGWVRKVHRRQHNHM
jgi:hypothetical protein